MAKKWDRVEAVGLFCYSREFENKIAGQEGRGWISDGRLAQGRRWGNG